MRCEAVGSQVLGFVCDADGNNARLMKLLHGRTTIPEGGRLPIDIVRTVNPWDPANRHIYLFHCTTYELKAMQNMLSTSWCVGGKKQFLDENDSKIGKAIIEECFERDRQ